ncbi:uncharacterized protein [Scyliorhinus torazame]|uniref:uncharacterized protein n=1 Tax=Scyliorhinus torazame TaxID=75743 RepID=UPI003B590D61
MINTFKISGLKTPKLKEFDTKALIQYYHCMITREYSIKYVIRYILRVQVKLSHNKRKRSQTGERRANMEITKFREDAAGLMSEDRDHPCGEELVVKFWEHLMDTSPKQVEAVTAHVSGTQRRTGDETPTDSEPDNVPLETVSHAGDAKTGGRKSENSQDSDETMLDMNDDLPAETNEHIISDEDNSPEINLLTGAVITPSTLTKAKRISSAKELSATDCTTPDMSSVFSRHATSLGPSKLPLAETLISKTLSPEAETAVQPIWGSLTQKIMLPQGENLVARGNVEHKTNSQSRGSELPLVDLLRPLSSESLTNSLTSMNMSPEIGSTVEPLAERRNAFPVELLTALNNVPLMVSITPAIEALPSANGKSAIDSSTHDTPGVKTGALTLHDNDTQDDDDLTQISHYEPSSQSPKKTEHLEQTSIERRMSEYSQPAWRLEEQGKLREDPVQEELAPEEQAPADETQNASVGLQFLTLKLKFSHGMITFPNEIMN